MYIYIIFMRFLFRYFDYEKKEGNKKSVINIFHYFSKQI